MVVPEPVVLEGVVPEPVAMWWPAAGPWFRDQAGAAAAAAVLLTAAEAATVVALVVPPLLGAGAWWSRVWARRGTRCCWQQVREGGRGTHGGAVRMVGQHPSIRENTNTYIYTLTPETSPKPDPNLCLHPAGSSDGSIRLWSLVLPGGPVSLPSAAAAIHSSASSSFSLVATLCPRDGLAVSCIHMTSLAPPDLPGSTTRSTTGSGAAVGAVGATGSNSAAGSRSAALACCRRSLMVSAGKARGSVFIWRSPAADSAAQLLAVTAAGCVLNRD